jgi:hypothetical protein
VDVLQSVIESEAKQSLRLLRHSVPRNGTFLLSFNIVQEGSVMGKKTYALVQRVLLIAAIGIVFILEMGCANMQEKPSDRSPGATETRRREDQLARARQLLFEVEHSPSANLDELRNRLHQAQDETAAVLKVNPDDAEALELSRRIEDLLSKLAHRPHDDHPWPKK